MDFQKEYEILNTLNSDKILEIAFRFKAHKIKIYFVQKKEHALFILICENKLHSFVKNYCIYFKHGIAHINGFFGKYHTYAKELANTSDGKFTEFYTQVREAIQSIIHEKDEYKISYLDTREALTKIKSQVATSKYSKDKIYFSHVKRMPISPEQYKKVSDILGRDVANYLKESNLTVVFTSDISRQKTFILPSD